MNVHCDFARRTFIDLGRRVFAGTGLSRALKLSRVSSVPDQPKRTTARQEQNRVEVQLYSAPRVKDTLSIVSGNVVITHTKPEGRRSSLLSRRAPRCAALRCVSELRRYAGSAKLCVLRAVIFFFFVTDLMQLDSGCAALVVCNHRKIARVFRTARSHRRQRNGENRRKRE